MGQGLSVEEKIELQVRFRLIPWRKWLAGWLMVWSIRARDKRMSDQLYRWSIALMESSVRFEVGK